MGGRGTERTLKPEAEEALGRFLGANFGFDRFERIGDRPAGVAVIGVAGRGQECPDHLDPREHWLEQLLLEPGLIS